MAAYDLLRIGSNGQPKRLPSSASTVDFLSIKIGASGLEILEASGHFDFSAKKLTNIASGTAAGEALSYSQLGAVNGVASLDGTGKVPAAQLPSAVMTYEGVWNASTNSPTLADGVGDAGMVYRVGTAGTQDLGSGSIAFDVGDYAIYNGTTWEKSDTTDAVASVNGLSGVVTLVTDNIAEDGSPVNLWFTDPRALAAAVQSGTITDGVTKAPTHDAVFDALAGKSDTGHTHTAANITDFDSAALTAAVQSGAITDGVTKAPTHDAVFDALALKADAASVATLYDPSGTWTNSEGGSITARQVVYQTASGQVQLAQANDSLAPHSVFRMVKTASVADAASTGEYWKAGAKVPGFTGLTVGSPIYLSRSSAGGYAQDLTGFVAGEHVVSLGRVLSTTEIEFWPEYKFEY